MTGFANHAGTTPMTERQDALVAASQLTLAVREIVTAEPGRQVGTVGHARGDAERAERDSRLSASDHRASRPVDDEARGDGRAIRRRAAADRVRDRNAGSRSRESSRNPPANASSDVQHAIERAAGGAGARQSRRLPSGAGHDAQMMAQLVPMGMIFVPSIGGISHSPKELTNWQDCVQGADVLLRTVLEMDRVG